MSLRTASLHVGLCMVLACPLAVHAQGDSAWTAEPVADAPALQLAAAIGIVKPKAEPEPEPVPEQVPEPAPPAAAAAQQAAAETPEVAPEEEKEESGGVTRNQILVGVGVAALIGVLAGGGGGGSSTPSHGE